MATTYTILVLTVCVSVLDFVVSLNSGEICRTPYQHRGECISIRKCSSLLSLIGKTPISTETTNFLKNSQCGIENAEPLVCCPLTRSNLGDVSSDLLPNEQICGKQLSNRILGGEVAEINEYPWMAMVKFDIGPNLTSYTCGGALVNNKYILTAAHCFNKIPSHWHPINVRLGEYDLRTETDCVKFPGLAQEKCSNPPVDSEIDDIIVHEEYAPDSLVQENDIALIRLKSEINFTEYITPICIPLKSGLRNQDFVGEEMVVAGWGTTENQNFSYVKLKLQVRVKSDSDCKSTYRRHAGINLKDFQLCAGGEIGKDSCTGDSGGSLMMRNGANNWFAMGIVSFGPSNCGTKNRPGIYTRVADYSEWIVNKLRP